MTCFDNDVLLRSTMPYSAPMAPSKHHFKSNVPSSFEAVMADKPRWLFRSIKGHTQLRWSLQSIRTANPSPNGLLGAPPCSKRAGLLRSDCLAPMSPAGSFGATGATGASTHLIIDGWGFEFEYPIQMMSGSQPTVMTVCLSVMRHEAVGRGPNDLEMRCGSPRRG